MCACVSVSVCVRLSLFVVYMCVTVYVYVMTNYFESRFTELYNYKSSQRNPCPLLAVRSNK